jgi:DNA gyrase subunit A
MQLRRLAALERQKIEDEYQEVMKTIAYLEDLLANPGKILALIKDDLTDIKEKYGDARRTMLLADASADLDEEDLVKDEEVLISITQHGYIKRVPSHTYRTQGRGGRGVTGMTTRDEDVVEFYLPQIQKIPFCTLQTGAKFIPKKSTASLMPAVLPRAFLL